MQTNTLRQQTTRRMTAAQKDDMMQERIAAGIAANEAHLKRQREITQMWHAAHAAGYDAAQLHALDMALMYGAHPTDLLSTIDPRSATERYADEFAAQTYETLADARPH